MWWSELMPRPFTNSFEGAKNLEKSPWSMTFTDNNCVPSFGITRADKIVCSFASPVSRKISWVQCDEPESLDISI